FTSGHDWTTGSEDGFPCCQRQETNRAKDRDPSCFGRVWGWGRFAAADQDRSPSDPWAANCKRKEPLGRRDRWAMRTPGRCDLWDDATSRKWIPPIDALSSSIVSIIGCSG
ncbi:unnamed protein product, partial [Mycena citricolor]